MIDAPSAHKTFYAAGEGFSVSSDENTGGYWVFTSDELKTLMKY